MLGILVVIDTPLPPTGDIANEFCKPYELFIKFVLFIIFYYFLMLGREKGAA
jgi:hypothetical protein